MDAAQSSRSDLASINEKAKEGICETVRFSFDLFSQITGDISLDETEVREDLMMERKEVYGKNHEEACDSVPTKILRTKPLRILTKITIIILFLSIAFVLTAQWHVGRDSTINLYANLMLWVSAGISCLLLLAIYHSSENHNSEQRNLP